MKRIHNGNESHFTAQRECSYYKDLVRQEFTNLATPRENAYIEAFCLPLENDVIHIHRLDFIHLAAMKNRDYNRAN